MRAKSVGKVDAPDGHYRARLGGKIVTINRFDKPCKFEVDYDTGALSIGVYVTIKDGYATVVSNNHY